MNGRERIMNIFHRKEVDHAGFWIGMPHDETNEIYFPYFGVDNSLDLSYKLGSDMHVVMVHGESWKHPDGRRLFESMTAKERKTLAEGGGLVDCETLSEVEAFPWPDPKYLNFIDNIAEVERARAKGMAIFSGLWTPFFHDICGLLGMENYFIKMHTHPEIVTAVTERVIEYYLEGNRMYFDEIGDRMDVFFFGNDLGSQLDLLISPEHYDTFVLPYKKKIIDLAKSRGYKVMLHSCGAVSRIIPKLIEAGVDALHPIQAKANGMDADSLAKYANDLIFVGGVDTQEILPFGTTEQVKNEVRRIKSILGSGLIVSPSHETILPNVSVENVLAMQEAAVERGETCP